MAKKRVKVAKYTKEKNAKAWENYYAEQAALTYSKWENMHYILREAWEHTPNLIYCLIVIIMAQTAENLCEAYTDKYIVALALGESARIPLAVISLLLIFGTRFFRFLVCEAGEYGNYMGRFPFVMHLSRNMLQKGMETDYENNESAHTGDLHQKAMSSAEWIAANALTTMQNILKYTLNIFVFSAILSLLSPAMLLIACIPPVLCYAINRHKMMWVWNMADNWQTFERQLIYIQQAGKDIAHAKDVRIFGMERWFSLAFDRSFRKRMDWYEQQDMWERRWDMLQITVDGVGKFAAYAYVIYLMLKGQISAGSFVLYFNSIMTISYSTRQWCESYAGLSWLSTNINYMRNYFEMEDVTNRGEGIPVPEESCEIVFQNVSYTYHGAGKPIIDNLSFTLHKGEKLALVGENGAGKTTLIKLMCGLYEPTAGEIRLNGVPVNEYNRQEYFRIFSTVFQDVKGIGFTIAENIASAGRDKINREKLYSCMKKAGIYDDVMRLPEQENTYLEKQVYDNATDLSGGQMQKLALAKALYKDAPVLLLDEPTAALDAIAEQEMYLQYAEFGKSKSSVFISHRLASTRFCDRILLLADGKIVESGTHEELMKAGGKYAEMFEIQSRYYKEDADAVKENNER